MKRNQGIDSREDDNHRIQSNPDSEVRTSRVLENRENGVKLNNFRAISDSPTRQPQLTDAGNKFIDEGNFLQPILLEINP